MSSIAEGIATFDPLFSPACTFLAYLLIKAIRKREDVVESDVAGQENATAEHIPLVAVVASPAEDTEDADAPLLQTTSTAAPTTAHENSAPSNSRQTPIGIRRNPVHPLTPSEPTPFIIGGDEDLGELAESWEPQELAG